jgi:excisionase family DNA binding protein
MHRWCSIGRLQFINFVELRQILGVGDKLARKLVRQGRIPAIRVGPRKVIFERQAVIDAMKAMQEGGPSL